MKRHKDISGQLLLWEPNSDWSAPLEFPRLEAPLLGFDVETRDPNLKSKGPGFLRQDAEVVGFSLSDGSRSFYFPFAHGYGENLSRERCVKYLQSITDDTSKTLVGANTMYEREALWSLNIEPRCKIVDVQIAEPLIDEESLQGYALEKLSLKYLKQPKDEELLIEAAKAFGVDPKSGLWQLAPKYVGPYAEWDAWAPVHIWTQQQKEIRIQALDRVLELELAVQPLLFEMRKQGIPVDVDAAAAFALSLRKKQEKVIAGIHEKYYVFGLPKMDIWSGKVLQLYCDKYKIYYPQTSKGNPSFTKDYLETAGHPFFTAIRKARELDRLSSTFVEGWVINNAVNGWVHPEWRQLASDDGGTRTGRMAASNPNPQQIPGRTKIGKQVRQLFTHPDKLWCKADYSQQEPRILVHFAYLFGFTGSDEVRNTYHEDPDADFYQIMMTLANVERRAAKDLYLGRCYGMGVDKLAHKLNVDRDSAREILNKFDAKVPFVKLLADQADELALQRGYIKTLSGRRRHFNMWEPCNYQTARDRGLSTLPVSSRQEALSKWPGLAIRRAFTHKALNSLIQGSAADMTKMAMLKVWRETGKVPYMQVHDELDYPVDCEAEAEEIKRCMEKAYDLAVPIKVDLDIGRTWK